MDTQQFQDFLKKLEGFKSAFRNFHWNAVTLAEHKLCDSIMDSVIEFQDKIAESGFGLGLSKFGLNEFSPIQNFATTVMDGLNELEALVIGLRQSLEFSLEQVDFLALCDDYLGDIRKFKYLSTLN